MSIPLVPRRDQLQPPIQASIAIVLSGLLWLLTLTSTSEPLVGCLAGAILLGGLASGWGSLCRGSMDILAAARWTPAALNAMVALFSTAWGILLLLVDLCVPQASTAAGYYAPTIFFASACTVVALQNLLPPPPADSEETDTHTNTTAVLVAVLPPVTVASLAIPYVMDSEIGLTAVIAAVLATVAAGNAGWLARAQATQRRCLDGIFADGESKIFPNRLAAVDTLVVSKRAVLTEGRYQLTHIHPLDESRQVAELLQLATASEFALAHPLREALLRECGEDLKTIPTLKKYRYYPARGLSARIGGRELVFGNIEWLGENGWNGQELNALRERFKERYADGETVIYLALGGELLGAFSFADLMRKESAEFLKRARSLGLRVIVASGDSEATVQGLVRDIPDVEVRAGLAPDEEVDLVRKLHTKTGNVAWLASSKPPEVHPFPPPGISVFTVRGESAANERVEDTVELPALSTLLDGIELVRRARRRGGRTQCFHAVVQLLLLPAGAVLSATQGVWPLALIAGPLLGALWRREDSRLARARRRTRRDVV